MAGNVWEWVADWYDSAYYGKNPSSNPVGPSSGQSGVLRGGSWNLVSYGVRTAYRIVPDPKPFNDSFGFRCAAAQP